MQHVFKNTQLHKGLIPHRCTSVYNGGSSWGKNNFIILLATFCYVENIWKIYMKRNRRITNGKRRLHLDLFSSLKK